METRMKKHIVKAVIAIMLVLTLCSSTVYAAGGKAKGRKTKQKITDENGVNYSVSMDVLDEENFTLEYINEETRAKTQIVFSKGKMTKTDYVYVGKSIFGGEKYKKAKEERQDVSGMIRRAKDSTISSAGYGAYRYMTIAYKSNGNEYYHYYRIGTSSPDLGYVEIGCVRGYRLKNDAPYFNDYKQKVDENIRETGLVGCSAAVMVAACIILLVTPSKVLAGAALAALGIDATGIYHLYKAYAAYKEADTYFDMTKAYGTRVY